MFPPAVPVIRPSDDASTPRPALASGSEERKPADPVGMAEKSELGSTVVPG